MSDSISNKTSLILIGCIGIFVSVCIAFVPMVYAAVGWDSSITWAGTFCSIVGIALAIFQICGIQNSTERVRQAINDNRKSIQKAFSISDISRNFELVNTISIEITNMKYELAQLLMINLQDTMIEFASLNHEEIVKFHNRLNVSIQKLGSDIENIGKHINSGFGFESDIALRNLNNIRILLSEIKAVLKH